jgi:hypothetical protein
MHVWLVDGPLLVSYLELYHKNGCRFDVAAFIRLLPSWSYQEIDVFTREYIQNYERPQLEMLHIVHVQYIRLKVNFT